MRFFSPPEKPTLSARFSMSFGMSSWLAAALTRLMKSGVVSSTSPRAFALGVERRLEERHRGDARDLERVLEGEEEPRCGALVGLHLEDVLRRRAGSRRRGPRSPPCRR